MQVLEDHQKFKDFCMKKVTFLEFAPVHKYRTTAGEGHISPEAGCCCLEELDNNRSVAEGFGIREFSALWEWKLARQCLRQFYHVGWKTWIVPKYKCAFTNCCPQLCQGTSELYCASTIGEQRYVSSQKRQYLCTCLWPNLWKTWKHWDGMQWEGMSVISQCAVMAVNAADRASMGKPTESQRKWSVQCSLEFHWEQIHQLKTFLWMSCCLRTRLFSFLVETSKSACFLKSEVTSAND